MSLNALFRTVFLNRRDASRYGDLKTLLLGLEIFLKIPNLLILTWIWPKLLNLVSRKSIWVIILSKICIYFAIFGWIYIKVYIIIRITRNTTIKNFDRDSNLKNFFFRDSKPKRLRNTDLEDSLSLFRQVFRVVSTNF